MDGRLEDYRCSAIEPWQCSGQPESGRFASLFTICLHDFYSTSVEALAATDRRRSRVKLICIDIHPITKVRLGRSIYLS